MAQTKFSAGERVSVSRSGGLTAPVGHYSVITALPQGNGGQQYRVRSEKENFDRIVDEARLEIMSYE